MRRRRMSPTRRSARPHEGRTWRARGSPRPCRSWEERTRTRSSAGSPPVPGRCASSRNLTTVVSRFKLERRRHLGLARGGPVHVHDVVLAVGADQPEEDRRPAPEAEPPLLVERPGELDRPAAEDVVLALLLRHAAHEHAQRRRRARRQVDPRAAAHLTLNSRSACFLWLLRSIATTRTR